MQIPDKMNTQEDVTAVLDNITTLYSQMVIHGILRPGCAEDERRLLVDLNEKTPKGVGGFRMWFYGSGSHEHIDSVRLWMLRQGTDVMLG